MLGNFQERLEPLSEAQAIAEAKRCMSCGMCFECDNCVVYCPQTAVARVPKKEATTGRYVLHRLRQVHRLPHLRGRVPDRLHPDGARRVEAMRPLLRSRLGALLLAPRRRCRGATPPATASRVPLPKVAAAEPGKCVEDTAYMRRNHMELLKHHRDRTVREGVRTTQHSLANCVTCHASRETGRVTGGKDAFCEGCHRYAAVQLDCFDCHADAPKAKVAASQDRRRTPSRSPPGSRADAREPSR